MGSSNGAHSRQKERVCAGALWPKKYISLVLQIHLLTEYCCLLLYVFLMNSPLSFS